MKRDIEALIAFIGSRQNVPHEIGRENNDCVGYVLAAAEAQTGQKPAPKLKWSSTKGIAALIKRFGSLEAAFDAHFDRIAPARAMRGDIGGVADEQFGIHPMIVEGMTLVGPGDRGNKRVKRAAMIAAWSAIPKAK